MPSADDGDVDLNCAPSRIMHSCHNGHKDFDDSSVVFLIRFEKIWKYQNVMLRSSDR